MNSHTQKPLNISVSDIKAQSLQKQVDLIGHALTIFCLDSNVQHRDTLKNDAQQLVRMLDELEQSNQRKTSLFNVLAKGTRRVIAERVTFDKAMQYQGHKNLVIKFSGMEVSA